MLRAAASWHGPCMELPRVRAIFKMPSIPFPAATDPQGNRSRVFWGDIAPCEHLVQIYQDDGVFFDSLEGFVGGGLAAGDGVIVIATSAHIAQLESRLKRRGVSLALPLATDQYIPLDAETAMAKFLVDGWPDEARFERMVRQLLARARSNGRRVRAFGEMVALMWAQGLNGATVRLEHLWHRLCHREGFSLFCAYPRSGFTQDADASIKEICETHSRVVSGEFA